MSSLLLAVGLHLGSIHLPPRGYNNVNPGAYVVLNHKVLGANPVIGAYYNSVRRPTVYAGGIWRMGPVRIQAALGTGYRKAVVPIVAPGVDLPGGFVLSYIPRIGKMNDSHVLHLSKEF